jgi:hypothetical protein
MLDASSYPPAVTQVMPGRASHHGGFMKRILQKMALSFGAVVFLFAAGAIPVRAQSRELLQGTEVHLRLLTTLSTAVTKSGDPFVAEVTEPVYIGTQMILPAGARVRGSVGGVIHPRHFPLFRGQAAMSLSFRDLELDSRIFPVHMSILGLAAPSAGEKDGQTRKDVKVDEGQVVEAKPDLKGDAIAAAIGTTGGTVAGVVFGHVVRGFGIGLAGSTAYVLARRGKEVILPVQTVLMVRMDDTVNLPVVTAENQVDPAVATPR